MDKLHIKSQTAMEFMILSAFLLCFFVIMLGIVSNNAYSLNRKRDIIIGEDIVTKIQKELNLAARVLDGYHREFILPVKLGRRDYNISIIGDEVIIILEDDNFWRRVPTVVGKITNGKNIINKTNGIIYLSQ